MSKILTLEELQKYVSKKQSYGAYTLSYLVQEGQKMPALKKLWGEIIFEASIIHFPSLRGSGKSLLLFQLLMMIAANATMFLGEKIELNGNVVYLDFEMPEGFIKRRAYKLYKNAPIKMGKFLDNFFVFSSKQSFEAEYKNIVKIIDEAKPVIVVIDNLRTALKNADTCSSVNMANFFSLLSGLREIYGCAFVVVDHLKKGSRNQKSDSDLQSGSGSKTDLADGDFMLRHSCQDKSLRLLLRLKSRMFHESDKCKLVRLNGDTLWFELVDEDVNESEHIGLSNLSDKDEMLDKAKDMKQKGMSLRDIAKALAKSKSTIQRWLGCEE